MDLIIAGSFIVFAAAFRGITGFGYALIAAIGLASMLPTDSLVPLVLINDLLITVMILANRKHGAVDWTVTPILLGSGFVGALLGGTLAGQMDEATTKILLSVVVCFSALLAMIRQPPRWFAHPILGVCAGLVVGILLTAFAVGGPLIAVWLLAGGTRRDMTLGTLAVFFGAVDAFGLISRFALGQVDPGLPSLLLWSVPLTLIGYWAGHWIGVRLEATMWRRVSALGLVAIALAGAAQTLTGLYAA